MHKYLLSFLVLTTALFAAPIDLSKAKWEYMVGDSPIDKNGTFVWTYSSAIDWKAIDYPSSPDDRGDADTIWFRVKLPDVQLRDPALFIFSIDVITEVYLNTRKVYGFGSFEKAGRGSYAGWPWHIITLPKDSRNQYLYFRVWSDFDDIGLWGEIILDDKVNHIARILNADMIRIVISSIAGFMGIVLFVFFLTRMQHREYFYLSILFLTQAADLFASTQLKQLLFFEPLLFQYILAFAYFFFPVGVALFASELVNKRGKIILRFVWIPQLLFLVFTFILSLTHIIALPLAYEWFDTIYYSFSLPILLLYLGYNAFKNGKEARLLFVGYLILALFYLYSTLVALSILPWSPYPTYVGILIFLCILVFLLIMRYADTHQKLQTETKRADEQEKTILEQNNKVFLGEMLYAITHQWTQPLTAMSMYVADIREAKEENNPQRIDKATVNLKQQITYMADTMKSFRNFAKPSSQKEYFLLQTVLKQAFIILEGRLKKNKITIQTTPFEDMELQGRKEVLLQVFLILYHNAIDAITSKHIQDGNIKITAIKDEAFLHIAISDNGGGIEESLLDQLFKKRVTTKGDEGTGVGLGIAKAIIEKEFKGKIGCKNDKKGAVFEIKLPIEQKI